MYFIYHERNKKGRWNCHAIVTLKGLWELVYAAGILRAFQVSSARNPNIAFCFSNFIDTKIQPQFMESVQNPDVK